MIYEKCREILLKESELVQNIASLQKLIHQAVVNRNWIDFEGQFAALNQLAGQFSALESEREQLFAGIQAGSGDSPRFYTLVMRLPAEQRNELTAIYRSLKLETLKVRTAGETLTNYIAEARATMAGFFRIAFPDRGGKIYTPHGRPVSHDMRSMVLNRIF